MDGEVKHVKSFTQEALVCVLSKIRRSTLIYFNTANMLNLFHVCNIPSTSSLQRLKGVRRSSGIYCLCKVMIWCETAEISDLYSSGSAPPSSLSSSYLPMPLFSNMAAPGVLMPV